MPVTNSASSATSATPAPSAQAGQTNAPRQSPQRVRHPLRFRLLEVCRVEQLTPHMTRVTLAGEALSGFVSLGFDDHVKLIFPDPQTGLVPIPDITPDGPVWGQGGRPTMRDYTPRHFDAEAGTLEIDFALHSPAGPATRWAEQAQVGQKLGIGGPKGSFILPTDFDWHLMVGDDTAIPAIARRLAEMPSGARARVLIEVDGPADHTALPSAAELEVEWFHRSAVAPDGQGLVQALRRMRMPMGYFYAWIACESAQAKALRAYLVDECRLSPQSIRASGYWRRGRAATHESFDS